MSTKKTAKKSSRKTTKKSANKATKKTAKKTTNKAARKVTKPSKRKAVKKAAKKTAKKAAKKVAKKVAKKAAKKVAKKTARKATKATKKKTANKTIKSKSTKKSAKKSTRKVATPRLVKPLRKRPKRSYARSSKKAPGLSRRAAQKPIKAWCSWCFDKSKHVQHTEHGIFRNEFQCRTCENYTKVCQVPSCSNRARSRPINECEEDKGFRKSIGKLWGGTFCAVHAGEIANFDTLGLKLRDLTQYPKLLERNSTNMAKVAKVGCGVAAGVSVVTPFACAAAPAIASALGTMGALGGAAGGTMISSLSGAALTSASLAALGPAGMAGGVATITAIGGALGGRPGAVVSNAYFGDIKDFKIEKVRRGAGPALIFIDGFLTQKKQHCDDWLEGVKEVYPNNPCYYVSWESGTLLKLGLNLPKEKLVLAAGKELAKRGGKAAAKKINPLSWVTMSSNVIANPWHTSMRKAQMTGVLLADILARTNHKEGFILMGHSLGARVAYYLLEALSTKSKARVQRAYLLGGAVGKDDDDGWTKAMKAIRSTGKLYNCYTSNDMILERLYRNVTARRSYPIGLAQIPISSYKLKNIDVSPWVSGHTMHKEALSSILRRLHRV